MGPVVVDFLLGKLEYIHLKRVLGALGFYCRFMYSTVIVTKDHSEAQNLLRKFNRVKRTITFTMEGGKYDSIFLGVLSAKRTSKTLRRYSRTGASCHSFRFQKKYVRGKMADARLIFGC